MPIVQAVTLESPHFGAIELTSHDFQSTLTLLIASALVVNAATRNREICSMKIGGAARI